MRRLPSRRPAAAWRAAALAALLVLTGMVGAAAQTLPILDGRPRMGVPGCATEGCHNASGSAGSVRGDEWVTWHRLDPHSDAYATLREPRSVAIIRNLGSGWRPAHQEPRCLACHADVGGGAGGGTSLAEGVGCEACHGGAGGEQKWIGTHLNPTAARADLIAAGMYPTWDVSARATLCLSCHVGAGGRQWVTHEMMGAGHPRLVFELDTYTETEPPHWDEDADYVRRKGSQSHARDWAVGQARQAAAWLSALTDERQRTQGQGVFGGVEWVNFDCHSCHTPQTVVGWAPRNGIVRPGLPHLHDANLEMSETIAHALGLNACAVAEGRARLHGAVTRDAASLRDAAQALRGTMVRLAGTLEGRGFNRGESLALMAAIVAQGTEGPGYVDFASGEQATMAISALAANLGLIGRLQGSLDALFAATSRAEAYRPDLYAAALTRFVEAARADGVTLPAARRSSCGA